MSDLLLAVGHHVLVFALAGILAYEIGVVRVDMSARAGASVARVDLWYGILAVAIIVVGFTRATVAAKGWGYYSVNAFFWAKIATFAVVGLLSIGPTVIFIRWRRAAQATPAFTPSREDIRRVRRFLWAEVAFFALIPIFAAAMARGYGIIG